MLSPHSFLECGGVKRLRFAAVLAFDQRSANTFRLGAAFLFPPDKIADIFAVVDVVPFVNLRLDPLILLIRQRNGFAYSPHTPSKEMMHDFYHTWIQRESGSERDHRPGHEGGKMIIIKVFKMTIYIWLL
jgi:hypothetical protein